MIFFQAIDQDTVDRITYKFSTGEFSVFNIDSSSGIITNNQVLQFETKNRYIFTVTTAEGESSGALSASATVTINLQVCNLRSVMHVAFTCLDNFRFYLKNFHVYDDPELIELYSFLVKCALFL